MNITTIGNCIYGDLIRRFIIQEFPRSAGDIGHDDLIELLTTLVLGNNRQRQGPNPKPEVIVNIRNVIRKSVAKNYPIPFMVPWGSVKPDGSSLDVAELMTVKNFAKINRTVGEIYRPGVRFAVRLEDVSMPFFQLIDKDADAVKAKSAAAVYTQDFQQLVKVLGAQDFILLRPESEFVNIDEFSRAAGSTISTLEEALRSYRDKNPMAAEATLDGIGWLGGISWEMREYYLGLYRNLYPDKGEDFHYKAMARYLASALTRKKLGLRGDLPEWDGEFIDFALAPPVPGTSSLFGSRVYRRSVSSRISGRHVAPWRAKGYLSINNEDEISVKLRSFREAPPDLNVEMVRLSSDDGKATVDVRADWICCE